MEQVTSVAWCPYDWMKIVTCSDDCAVRIWTASSPGRNDPTTHKEGRCVKHDLEGLFEYLLHCIQAFLFMVLFCL